MNTGKSGNILDRYETVIPPRYLYRNTPDDSDLVLIEPTSIRVYYVKLMRMVYLPPELFALRFIYTPHAYREYGSVCKQVDSRQIGKDVYCLQEYGSNAQVCVLAACAPLIIPSILYEPNSN